METNLRQSKASVKVEGILSSKDLEVIKDKNGNNCIRGKIGIKVDDTNTISFKVFVGEKTSKGEINKAWAGINTVMNDYKSIADVGADAADRVHVNGQFNTYRNQNGEDICTYQSNFFTRVTRPLDPKREFEAEMFINNKYPEVDSEGEFTGRIKVKGIAPNYNGIDIIEFVIPEDLADQADSMIEIGTTAQFWGDIVNAKIEKKIPVALGKPKTETTYINELVLTGMSEVYPEERAYDAEAIKLALQEYEATQSQNAKKTEEKKPERPSAAGSGRTMTF